MEPRTEKYARIREATRIVVPLYPGARPLLHYKNCFELLIAVILSAQCTDEQVNRVTPSLFSRWPTPEAVAAAPIGELETCLRSTGFFRMKAANVKETARLLVERHGSRVPDTIEALVELPGVGRKTANLVVSGCYGKPGIVVDTHVSRVCLRLGFSENRAPERIERMLAEALEEATWTAASYALNRLGKLVCHARKPECPGCPLRELCPSADSFPQAL